MKILQTWFGALMLGLILSAAGSAAQDKSGQDPKKEDAKKEGQEKPDGKSADAEAVLVAFKGVVEVKPPDQKKWIAAKRNMKMSVKSEICVSYGASATLLLGVDIRIMVNSLTQARIDTLVKAGPATEAGVRLKFGSAEIDVKKTEKRADMRVATPNSTTSVAGSRAMIWAWAMQAWKYVFIRVYRGKWKTVLRGGTGGTVEDDGWMTFDLRREIDLMYDWLFSQSFDFWRPEREIYDPFMGTYMMDPMFGLRPPFEEGSQIYSPDAGRQQSESLLPLPPPPPP